MKWHKRGVIMSLSNKVLVSILILLSIIFINSGSVESFFAIIWVNPSRSERHTAGAVPRRV